MSIQEHWRITGKLTTLSPLHVGGGVIEKQLKQGGKNTKVAAVVVDADDMAIIPGSTLKGCLRAWLSPLMDSSILPTFHSLFGSSRQDAGDDHQGGMAEFWDARVGTPKKNVTVSHWDAKRQTGIEAAVVIDRERGSAAQSLLRHAEVVPAGITFTLTITGTGLTDDGVALLLVGLNGFNNLDCPLRLGEGTGSDYGRMRWDLRGVKKAGKIEVEAWLKSGSPTMLADCLAPVDTGPLCKKAESLGLAPAPKLKTRWRLSFPGAFLVNDPSRAETKKPDHNPLLSADGKICLPQRTARGVLRSRAERIIRTLGGHACYPGERGSSCKAIGDRVEVENLCDACRIFGAGGWKSPLLIGAIEPCNAPATATREFLPIDRFTGGNIPHLKFNSAPAMGAEFTLALSLNPGSMPFWGLGLLALVLRDLAEGDLHFGMAGRIGFGACTARLESWRVPAGFRFAGTPAGGTITAGEGLPHADENTEQWRQILHDAVAAFQQRYSSNRDEEARE